MSRHKELVIDYGVERVWSSRGHAIAAIQITYGSSEVAANLCKQPVPTPTHSTPESSPSHPPHLFLFLSHPSLPQLILFSLVSVQITQLVIQLAARILFVCRKSPQGLSGSNSDPLRCSLLSSNLSSPFTIYSRFG